MLSAQGKFWFRSRYGFGWYPTNIKGWIVFIFYFAFLIYIFLRINSTPHTLIQILITMLPFIFGATIVLLFICYLTGEPIKIKNLKI